MQVFKTGEALNNYLNGIKKEGKTIGFVPTMGALHRGHLSLIIESKKCTDVTVASIFVNPTQFNNPNDLKNYPRDLEKDLNMLEGEGCDVVFAPSVEEMYPEPDTRHFNFSGLDSVMEGEHRPGHFNGVGQIVSKLFDKVLPHKAFFGLKDFQQLAIIKQLKAICNYNIDIVACDIIREEDGLAMSSRNQLLSEQHRTVAPLIYKTLQKSLQWTKINTVDEVKGLVAEAIKAEPLLKMEYFDIVDQVTLKSLKQFNSKNGDIGCIAVWAGNVRLIDNIIYNY